MCMRDRMKKRIAWPYLQEQKDAYTIGVFSLHPHAGATYVTVLLAEYLSNMVGFKTAVIGNGLRYDLHSLQNEAKTYTKDETFVLHHITYDCTGDYLGKHQSNSQEFECYVYDLGSNYGKARELIHACDLVFLLFTMTPWYCDLSKLSESLAKDYGESSRLCLIGNQIPQRLKKQLYKEYHCEFLSYEPDLFEPSLEAIQLFHRNLW